MRILALSVLMCACAVSAVLQAAEKPLKVGLILAGSATDGGWNQLAKEGLDKLKADLQAETSLVQKVSADKAGDELRAFAADHFDLVIAHGYEFLVPAGEVAAGAPDTHFAVSGADVAKAGLATLDFDVSQASYQLGVLAARLSKNGKLGFIGGAPFPSVKACYRGFLAGALSVRAKATVVEAYTSWDQAEQNKAQTEAFINQGIDVIYPDVDAASRGVYEAVAEANAKNPKTPVYSFGCVGDANASPIAGRFIVASAVIKIERAFERLAEQVRMNGFVTGVQKDNLVTGTCVTVLNPALFGSVITPALAEEIEKVRANFVDGKIVIPDAPKP